MILNKILAYSLLFVASSCTVRTPEPLIGDHNILMDPNVIDSTKNVPNTLEPLRSENRTVIRLKSILGESESFDDYPMEIPLCTEAGEKNSDGTSVVNYAVKKTKENIAKQKSNEYKMKEQL